MSARIARRAILGLHVAVLLAILIPAHGMAQGRPAFARQVAALSEPGGFFDTDNLISNELSFLHVLGPLERLGVRGGAYIGVGPDQNFSYIAEIQPEVAYIIDIRRDNLLLHLLFKALMEAAPTRVEFLALLLGRSAPPAPSAWRDRSINQLALWFDSVSVTRASEARARTVAAGLSAFGVPVSEADLATAARFHGAFITNGLDLRFTSQGRPSRGWYPTFRDLLLARDRTGVARGYLVSEERYQRVRQMQLEDRIIPVVGNLAGPTALAAIGRDIAARGLEVSALYTSNVEWYLFLDDSFGRFAATASQLPRSSRSMIIRSYFNRGGMHPQAVSGFLSTQLLQPLDAFARTIGAGGFQGYMDLVTRDLVPPA